MSIVRVQVSLVVCASLASIAGTALAQVPPTPPPDSAAPAPPAPPVPAEPPAPAAPPAPVAPPAPAAPPAAPVPAPPTAALPAKADIAVLEVTDPDAVSGCRDLGEEHADTKLSGASGRLEIRNALKQIGQARGASHVLYTGFDMLAGSYALRGRGHFYDCRAPASSVPGAAAAGRRSIAVSAQLELLPVGTLHLEATGQSDALEVDTVTAYGISGSLEYLIAPEVALGVNPGLVFGIRGESGTNSATEFDLRARLRLGKLSTDGLGGYAYASAGASWIMLPNDAPSPSGAVLGLGVAVSHPVEHTAFITVEVGYQFGTQSVAAGSLDLELSTRLFHIALGIGSYL